MTKLFGTDGIRGIPGKSIDYNLAFKVGNALCSQNLIKVLVACDTRPSSHTLSLSVMAGLTAGGANVTFAGVLPTPAVSYLTKLYGFDYGVMITASHNPSIYNGIKIFDKSGHKIDNNLQDYIEANLNKTHCTYTGKFTTKNFTKDYLNLFNPFVFKRKFKVVIDCANGCSMYTVPKLLSTKHIKFYKVGYDKNGRVNDNCGALCVQKLRQEVLCKHADVGFAFDGDADRLVVIDEQGNQLSGEQVLFMLYRYFDEFSFNIVSTIDANAALKDGLSLIGANLILTDVGDKNVSAMMDKIGANLGGEPSGHIVLRDYLPSGDGALAMCYILSLLDKTNRPLSKLNTLKLYKAIKFDIPVKDKALIHDPNFVALLDSLKTKCKSLLIRPSGTEDVLRVNIQADDDIALNDIKNAILNYEFK